MEDSVILVISGTSGAGKTTQVGYLRERMGIERVVSYTTRSPGSAEKNGVDYHFVSDKDFDSRAEKGEFIEYAGVYGNKYGTPKHPVLDAIENNTSIILTIDVQGFLRIQQIAEAGTYPGLASKMKSVFLKTLSLDDLEYRLRNRTDRVMEEESIQRRLQDAKAELVYAPRYDKTIITLDRDRTYAEIVKFIQENS